MIWIIEENWSGKWRPTTMTYYTRDKARAIKSRLGEHFRVKPYVRRK